MAKNLSSKIIDKKIISKIEQALLYLTNPRIKEIIERRFGIRNGETETLDAIGKDYGITRERVRQLEENGIKVLKSDKALSLFEAAFNYLDDLFAEHGNIMGENYLYCATTGTVENTPTRGKIYLALTLGEPYQRIIKDDIFHPYWIAHESAKEKALKIVNSLIEYFKRQKKVFPEREVLNLLSKRYSNVPPKMFSVLLEIAKDIEKNIFGEIGLAYWPEVVPQGVKDRAYLLLKRQGEPKHFTAIADLINKAFVNKPAYLQTVHNELIKDPRFVLVGRGLYALTDWGYEPGTVEDVIYRALMKNKRPMTRKEVVDAVLAKRQVRPNTIILNLHRSPKVKRIAGGKYSLA